MENFVRNKKKASFIKAQLRAFLEDVVSDKHQCTRREFSYAYCLGSAGQERLLTEVDKPIGMTVQYELLERAGYAKEGIALLQGRFGCAVTGCSYLTLLLSVRNECSGIIWALNYN